MCPLPSDSSSSQRKPTALVSAFLSHSYLSYILWSEWSFIVLKSCDGSPSPIAYNPNPLEFEALAGGSLQPLQLPLLTPPPCPPCILHSALGLWSQNSNLALSPTNLHVISGNLLIFLLLDSSFVKWTTVVILKRIWSFKSESVAPGRVPTTRMDLVLI